MPRGIYDRSTARPRRRRRASSAGAASLSKRIEQMSKQLAALSEEVKRTEAVQAALAPFMSPAASVTATGRRRGRPPGSKNKPKTAASGAPRRRGRPPGSKNKPKVAAMSAAPRRRGRPRKNPAA